MAARVSAEGAGPSYASVLNFRGSDNNDSNKENIEAAPEEVTDVAPRQDDEEEEGFVPVISHGRRPGKGRRERERRAPPRPHKAPQPHNEPQHTQEQQAAAEETQPKKFVEAPIPKVNPWQSLVLGIMFTGLGGFTNLFERGASYNYDRTSLDADVNVSLQPLQGEELFSRVSTN
ncbi:unnamed protein product [Diatraea saccharalis]|uniref:Uncharacterized protein n=1 Tax=Diatraea saccharalis TaxID=40085 RepID=A0A9N9R5I5_9NEOP|nr:unnamed protein product [Diatraea saccharalis]